MKTTASNIVNQIALPGILLIAGLPGIATAASKSWTKSAGDTSKAAYSIGSTVTTSATTSAASARGSAFADIAVLGSGWKRIANASGDVSGTKTSFAASGRVEFLGGTLWSASKSGSLLSFNASMPYVSKTWKPPVSPFFMVGPVKVKVTPSVSVGIGGSVSGSVTPTTQAFTASITPVNFDCSAGVTASVAAGLVRAKGSVTVCKVSPKVASTCSWKARTATSSATLAYSTLGGAIDLEAGKSWYEYKYNLMSWSGLSGSQTLFNESVKF